MTCRARLICRSSSHDPGLFDAFILATRRAVEKDTHKPQNVEPCHTTSYQRVIQPSQYDGRDKAADCNDKGKDLAPLFSGGTGFNGSSLCPDAMFRLLSPLSNNLGRQAWHNTLILLKQPRVWQRSRVGLAVFKPNPRRITCGCRRTTSSFHRQVVGALRRRRRAIIRRRASSC